MSYLKGCSVAKHAFLSASSAHRWTRCAAAPWREKDLPDITSSFAEEGIRAHELLEELITCGAEGRLIESNPPKDMHRVLIPVILKINSFADRGQIYSEQKLDISFITGEPDACGTADVVIVKEKELIIRDLKYGMGARVDAEENEQLLIYAAGALEKFDLLGEIETVTMAIDQPRLEHFDEWTIPAYAVRLQARTFKVKAQRILAAKGGDSLSATPGAVQCGFCKAKRTCPEYRQWTPTTVVGEFVDLDKEDVFLANVKKSADSLGVSDDRHLATCMDAVGLIEDWCKTVRGEIERRLLNGEFTDDRYKLVEGRRGHRKWADDGALLLKLENVFGEGVFSERKVISPAQAEKVIKELMPVPAASNEILGKLREQIIQVKGQPSVAPKKDKRNALRITDSFTNLDKEEPEFVDALLGLTKEGDIK